MYDCQYANDIKITVIPTTLYLLYIVSPSLPIPIHETSNVSNKMLNDILKPAGN